MRSLAPTPLPTRPPFTAHIGNLPYDATMEAVTEFFEGCGVQSVRIIEDREMQRPKGFAYVEFHELDGLKRALDLDSEQLNGRYIKVKVADPREFSPHEQPCTPPSHLHVSTRLATYESGTMTSNRLCSARWRRLYA